VDSGPYKNSILILFFLGVSFFSSLSSAFDGPLQIENQFPLFLHIDAPRLEKASIEDSLSASFSYSSVYMVKDSPQWSMGLDMEIAKLDLRLRKTIKNFIELGIEVPFLSLDSGFMDDFLNAYHSAFGFPDYGRHNRPDNKFLYEVRRNGVPVIVGENGRPGIGDVKFTLKKPLLEGDPAISVRGDIEIPTGDAKTGIGSGGTDIGIAVLIDKNLGGKFRSYSNLGMVLPCDLEGRARIPLREFLFGGTSIEASLWKDISLLAQVFVQGSPFPKTGIGSVDRIAVLFSLGGRYNSGKNSLEFSLTEDPNTAGAADFTLNLSLKRRF